MFSTPKQIISNIDISSEWEEIERALQRYTGAPVNIGCGLARNVKVQKALKKAGWEIDDCGYVVPRSLKTLSPYVFSSILVGFFVFLPPIVLACDGNRVDVAFSNLVALLPVILFIGAITTKHHGGY